MKKHNAEIHAQSPIDAALDIRAQPGFAVLQVRSIRLRTFAVAHQIIGGGQEGERHTARTKEEADHSLPYMIAVALIDGEVQPAQYASARIGAADVQNLLRKVVVTEDADLTARFPQQLPADLEVERHDGTVLRAERSGYHGFHTEPFDWQTARAKFDRLTAAFTTTSQRDGLADVIATLERRPLNALTSLLATMATTSTCSWTIPRSFNSRRCARGSGVPRARGAACKTLSAE